MSRKIAFVTNFLPAPANSGAPIRCCRLARALSRVGSVSLYARTSALDAEKYAMHQDLAPFENVRLHAESADVSARVSRVFTNESMAYWMATGDSLGRLLADDHARKPFDLVVCEQVFSVNVTRYLPDVPFVLDEHNIESHAISQILSAYSRARIPIDSAAATALVENYERDAWSRAALITCPTNADANNIRGHTSAPVVVVPNGVDTEEIPFFLPSQRPGKTILFVGAFFWPPNIKAAHFLVKEVLPKVRAVAPSSQLILCGKDPGIEVKLLRRDGVEITGTVPSILPYLQRATVYGNALFEGAGSSLKVLEALAAGIPLISTAIGARGHSLSNDLHFYQAETAEEFANTILAVFTDPATADARARESRLIANALSWTNVGEVFATAVAGVLP